MAKKEKIKFLLKYGTIGFYIYEFLVKTNAAIKNWGSDEQVTKRKYYKIYGKELNLNSPKTLNEKILWLKLFDRKDFYTICADKYRCREYLKSKFGEQYLIPLLYETTNWRNITLDVIPDIPCIIKDNHGSGDYHIIREKRDVDIKKIQRDCRVWLATDYYKVSQEWQYKNIERRIIIEKLLLTKEGRIPNDYKLHYINGSLEFVYCSVGRETINKRNIYDSDWQPLYFSWVAPGTDVSNIRADEIPAPPTYELMRKLGHEIAKDFPYVRVDFYDVDGKLYFGEITLYHGSGFDVMIPEKYDLEYGAKLKLPLV